MNSKLPTLFLIASTCLASCVTPNKEKNTPPLPLQLHSYQEPKCQDGTIEIGRWQCPGEVISDKDLPCWNGVFYENMTDCPAQIIEEYCWDGITQANGEIVCPPLPD